MTENDASSPGSQARIARRIQRPQAAVADAVILADLSDSMSYRDGTVGERMPPRRIDRLAKVLDYLLVRTRVRALVCFNDLPVEVPLMGRVALPEPAGSTALHVALEFVSDLKPRPRRCILISDGEPNSIEDALEQAKKLRPMILDCYYVGPESDAHALRFMADLAAAGGPGGKSGHFDMLDPVLLGSEVHRRLLLGGGRQ